MSRAYGLLVGAARLISPFVAIGNGKLARTLRARRRGGRELVAWGLTQRDSRRPTVWFHASSVGELLQAGAVCRELRSRRPDLQIAFTYFSPSAEEAAGTFPCDIHDAFPWDAPGPMRRVVQALDPELLVFTQREVWPVAATEARVHEARVALCAGTLDADSGRLRGWARGAMQGVMSQVDWVGAVGESDAERFGALGVGEGRLAVTGDPGVDSAAARLDAVDAGADHLAPFASPIPTVVAGSTWAEDEAVLWPALERCRESVGALRVVVAPHEPGPAAVRGALEALQQTGWATRTLAGAEASEGGVGAGEAVVVERVGVLASLYSVADVAYVGGGFGDKGLHSVLEPAAAGVPVLFGPRRTSQAAKALESVGAGRVVRDVDMLATALGQWVGDESARVTAGGAGRDYIDAQRGAAARTAVALIGLLDSAPTE